MFDATKSTATTTTASEISRAIEGDYDDDDDDDDKKQIRSMDLQNVHVYQCQQRQKVHRLQQLQIK